MAGGFGARAQAQRDGGLMDEGSNDGRNALAGSDLDLRVWRRGVGRFAKNALADSALRMRVDELEAMRKARDDAFRVMPDGWAATVRRDR